MSNIKEVYITQKGLEELEEELNILKLERRPAVINALKDARALGDLSENVVTLKYVDDGDTEKYSIVGVKEADPFANKISNESPIAKAIMGLSVGTIVTVDSPNGKYDVEILNIA